MTTESHMDRTADYWDGWNDAIDSLEAVRDRRRAPSRPEDTGAHAERVEDNYGIIEPRMASRLSEETALCETCDQTEEANRDHALWLPFDEHPRGHEFTPAAPSEPAPTGVETALRVSDLMSDVDKARMELLKFSPRYGSLFENAVERFERAVSAPELQCQRCWHFASEHLSPAIDLGLPVSKDSCQWGACDCREFVPAPPSVEPEAVEEGWKRVTVHGSFAQWRHGSPPAESRVFVPLAVEDAIRVEQIARDLPAALEQDLAEYRDLFEASHKAVVEATALWRAEDPENRRLTLPDSRKHWRWMLDRLTEAQARAETAEREVEALRAEAMTLSYLAEALHTTAARPGTAYTMEFDRAYEAIPESIARIRALNPRPDQQGGK